jgi:hypothetical protein
MTENLSTDLICAGDITCTDARDKDFSNCAHILDLPLTRDLLRL